MTTLEMPFTTVNEAIVFFETHKGIEMLEGLFGPFKTFEVHEIEEGEEIALEGAEIAILEVNHFAFTGPIRTVLAEMKLVEGGVEIMAA